VADASAVVIYVIDDDDSVRDSLRMLLESHGMHVRDFGSTAEFVARYERSPRACLVLDLHLPVVGGLDFLGSPAGRALDIPVIMITGRGDEAMRARAIEVGAAAYLEKPIEDGALIASIDTALGLNSER